ncbi:MAG: N-6 DNA methylase [Oscillospiraceae bacterium]|nr:N-6 DNA methylase [Oscillospiraceae bacterium]
MKTRQEYENDPLMIKAMQRNLFVLHGERVTYNIHSNKSYNWADPEEWVRARVIAYLVIEKSYAPQCIRTEIAVPRRIPEDFADILVYEDERCQTPYLVVECKREDFPEHERAQAIEQLFGNANSLRAPLALFDSGGESIFFDVANYPPMERTANIKGARDNVPMQYGKVSEFTYIAGPGNHDIEPVNAQQLEAKVRRAHSIIWAGGKRDPLLAFDEWSKLMYAKVEDERHTPNNTPRKFQVGTNETYISVASRIHALFRQACLVDPTVFPEDTIISLTDKKIVEVVKVLQSICITDTSVDNVGAAFEIFFGSVFRGELGQYFTMRPLSRFAVAMLGVDHNQYIIDPTCGSGGFLLEALLQVWNKLDKNYYGRSDLDRIKTDFARNQVFGIEIHDILARICKINLLLHHDGHTNVEGDRSCLDIEFSKDRLRLLEDNFNVVVGNPPFGDTIREGDEDQLGMNSLAAFDVAYGRSQVPSEHIILEKSIRMLKEDGVLAFVLPDGLFNNQGEQSNCPQVRRYLVKHGQILAVVSLPDFAFRKSGAQNKTSILFYQKHSMSQHTAFTDAYNTAIAEGSTEDNAILSALTNCNYKVFMAEADNIGYTPSGAIAEKNDLYHGSPGGHLDDDQSGAILGEYNRFRSDPAIYVPELIDCVSLDICEIWKAHESHRLDPKYHLFKNHEQQTLPAGWVCKKVSDLMARREELAHPEGNPDIAVKVMTLSQTGDIRARVAGKGMNPPEWLGMYFEDSPSTWYRAHKGDLVFSSIDLWKGCISVVGEFFDGALVTKEYPIYRMLSDEIDPEFLAALLRSRYYQKAFRAITTGHSNRRRTQCSDFESIVVCFPPDKSEQRALIADVMRARDNQKSAGNALKDAALRFSDIIDGRGDEQPEIDDDFDDGNSEDDGDYA